MKKLNVIFLILVFGLLSLPMLSMPFFKDRESGEKREMAEFPPVMRDGAINSRFAGELDDYVRDHIGFRTEMVEGNTVLLAKLFKESAEDDVIEPAATTATLRSSCWSGQDTGTSSYTAIRTSRVISGIWSRSDRVCGAIWILSGRLTASSC